MTHPIHTAQSLEVKTSGWILSCVVLYPRSARLNHVHQNSVECGITEPMSEASFTFTVSFFLLVKRENLAATSSLVPCLEPEAVEEEEGPGLSERGDGSRKGDGGLS